LSQGSEAAADALRKTVALGADEVFLLQDEAFEKLDAFGTAQVLAAAVRRIGEYDLILCGRQAGDL